MTTSSDEEKLKHLMQIITIEKSELEKVVDKLFDGQVIELGKIPANSLFQKIEVNERGDIVISYISQEEALLPVTVSVGKAHE